MYRGIECKIYPKDHQKELINMTFGHTRFIWNQMLAMLNARYQNNPELKMLSYNKLSALIPQMKREYEWLKDIDSVAIQCMVKRLSETFDRFFKGRLCKYPKFKHSKTTAQSYLSTIRGKNIRLNDNQRYIKLPKLGWMKCKKSFKHIENERIKSVTVKRKATGHYYISLLVTSENQALPKTGETVGIDLGLSDLAITSEGHKYASQRLHLKYKKSLHYWEKRMARRRIQAKVNGVALNDAKNYQTGKLHVARLHEKIANTRKDYIHKITTQLVTDYDIIAIEDLKALNMMKNHTLARSIAAQSWYKFRAFLKYKCEIYDKELLIIDPYKTSQLCSSCQFDSDKKALDIRHWVCANCNDHHDRDVNAARNILRMGLGQALVK